MQTVAEIVRPLLVLAMLAFLVGFLTCVAVGTAPSARAELAQPRSGTPAVTAAPMDDWNIPKRI